MKHVTTYLTTFIATVCCISCSEQQTNFTEYDLYSEMVNYSQHYATLHKIIISKQTKSSYSDYLDLEESDVDMSLLNEDFIDYVDLYTQSENIAEWDEHKVLQSISQNTDFNDNEKLIFALSIAFAYYIKNSDDIIITNASAIDQCYAAYRIASRRALRRAIFTLAVGLLEPTIAGETLAIGMYALDMMEADEDYQSCIAQI